jgi:hypothetical protein
MSEARYRAPSLHSNKPAAKTEFNLQGPRLRKGPDRSDLARFSQSRESPAAILVRPGGFSGGFGRAVAVPMASRGTVSFSKTDGLGAQNRGKERPRGDRREIGLPHAEL